MNEAMIGMGKEELDTPCLIVDLDVVEQNLKKMSESVLTDLRPHTKTHKCLTLAKKQLEAGAIGVACAKVGDAEVLTKAGIDDILIANQIVGHQKITRLLDIANEKLVRVFVDNHANVQELAAAAEARKMELHVLVELELGMNRCGVPPGKPALELTRTIVDSRGLVFDGLAFYEGHASKISDLDERTQKLEECLERVIQTKELLEKAKIPVEMVSSGSTFSYAITGHYPGITEIRPGTYVFMDTSYRQLTSDFDCALTVLGTVVSTPSAQRVVIDAGKTSMTQDKGLSTLVHPEGWKLAWLHETHGGLERIDGPPLFVGDKVEILPSHSCTTVNLYDQFMVCRKGTLETLWDISLRGKIQ